MPKITDFISPVTSSYYREPVALQYGDRMNSANTVLNNLFGNYYDAGLRDYENQESLRFNNQTGLNTFFNFAGNMGIRVAKSHLALGAGLTSLAYGAENLLDGNPKSKFSEGYDSSLFRDLNEAINYAADDMFPTFREYGFNERTFMQQMANPGQWLTSHRETLGIAAESMVGAKAVGLFKPGTRITAALARPLSYTKLFQNLRPNNYAKVAAFLDERIASTLIRTHESGAEAHEAWQTTIDKLKQQREQGLNNYTDLEISEMADQNFGNVFALDMVLGTITDSAFIRLFRPMFSKGAVDSRLNKFGLKLADSPTLDAFIEDAPKNMTKFKRIMESSVGDYLKVGKEAVLQGFSEGMEENMQFSNQEVNNGNNLRQSFLENAYAALENLVTEGLLPTNEERIKAIGAGALMGGGSAVATSLPGLEKAFGGGVLGQARSERKQKLEAKESLNKAFTDFVSTSLIEKEPDTKGKLIRQEQQDGTIKYSHQQGDATSEIDEDAYNQMSAALSPDEDGNYVIPGKIKTDAEGRVVKDLAKAAEFTATMQYQGELDNLIDLEAVKQNPDPIKLRMFELEKLSNLALTAFKSGTTDLLMKKLDSFKDMGEASLQRFGIDNKEDVNERIDKLKEHVAKLEANYLQTTNGMIASTYGQKDEAKFELFKNYTAGIGNRIVNLYSLMDDVDKQISETVMQVPDKARASWIMTAFETDNLEGRPQGTWNPFETKLAELVAKKKDLKSALEDLGGVYDRLTNPKQGYKEYKALAGANKLSDYKTIRDGKKVYEPNENSNEKTLTSYVAKRSNMLRQKYKLDTARAVFYSEKLGELINYIETSQDPIRDIVDSVNDVYDQIIKSGVYIEPADAAKLKQTIDTLEQRINLKEQELLQKGTDLGYDYEDFSDLKSQVASDIADSPEAAELFKELDTYTKDVRSASRLVNQKEKILNDIDNQTSIYNLDKTDSDFVKDALDELLQGPQRIIEVAEYEDGTISEYYDDVAAVQKQLDFAKLLQEKSLSKIDSPEYREASAKLEDIIKDLEKVLELAKENVKNLEVKNKKEDLHYAEAVLAFAPLVGGSTVVTQTPSTEAKEKDLQDQIDKVAEEKQKALEAFDDKALAEEPATTQAPEAKAEEVDKWSKELTSNLEIGKKILKDLGIKLQNRLSNGNVKGGQPGWKIRFNIKNPNTGKSYEIDQAEDPTYKERAETLTNFLLNYFGSTERADKNDLNKGYTIKDKDGTSRQPFKFRSGGEVGEKDFTIYIGSADDVSKFISDIRTKHPEIIDLLVSGKSADDSDFEIDDLFKGRLEGEAIGFSGYFTPTNLNQLTGKQQPVFLYKDKLITILYDGKTFNKNSGAEIDIAVQNLSTNESKIFSYDSANIEAFKNEEPEVFDKLRYIIGFQLYGGYLTGTNNQMLPVIGIGEKDVILSKKDAPKAASKIVSLENKPQKFVQSEEQKKKREKQRQDIVESYDAKIKSLKEAKAQLAAEPKAAATTTVSDIDLQKLIEEDPELAAMAVMDLLKENERSEEILKDLTEALNNILSTLDYVNSIGLLGPQITPEIIQEALKNPIRGIFEILRIISERQTSVEGPSALTTFNKDYDVIKFKEGLSSYQGTVPKETLEKLVELHAKFVGILQINDSEKSNFSHVEFLTKVREYLKANPTLPVPSSSQMRVVRELVTFAKAPVIQDAELYKNGAALKAPAGAGKSLVVSKLFKHVMGYADEEIRSGAAFEKAAANIAQSLGHPNEGKTVEQLITELENGTLPETVKFIVVDEAGPISRTTLNQFARAVNKYNRSGKKNQVKYLFLYDPNQPVAGKISKPALDDKYIGEFNSTETDYFNGTEQVKRDYKTGVITPKTEAATDLSVPLVQNLKQITSLSTTYRSGVSEVVDLQNSFKSDSNVTQVSTASSTDPSISMSNIYGTYAESGSSIVKKYAESQAANPERTRVILVGNAAKKAEYEKLLPSAEVIISSEAAGITVDEVYVDITREDVPNLFSNTAIFNQWLYGAISRATSYAHLANWPDATHFVDTKVKPYERSAVNNEETIKLLDERIKKLSELTNVTVPQTPVEKAKEEQKQETRTEEENKKTPDETPEGPATADDAKDNNGDSKGREPVKDSPGSSHTLKHPQYIALEESPENSIPPLVPGDELMLIVDNSNKPDGSPGKRVVLLRKITGKDSNITYYQLAGVIADTEISDFEKNVGVDTGALQQYALEQTAFYGLYKSGEPIENATILYVQPDSRGLKYRYDAKAKEDFSSYTDDEGKIANLPILKKFIDETWGQEALDDYNDVITNFYKYAKIVTFKNEKEAAKVFYHLKGTDKLPRPGVPYLVISDIKLKTGFVAKPQFIQLSTKTITKTHPLVAPVIKFTQVLQEFEKLLEEEKSLPDVYRAIRAGVPTSINGENYFAMHALVKLFSDAYHDPNLTELSFLTEKQQTSHLGKVFPSLVKNKINPKIFELAAELDFLIHGDLERTFDETAKKWKHKQRNFAGEAQVGLNAIASQNLLVTIDTGENAGKLVILRDYKTVYATNDKGGLVKNSDTSGATLLGPVTFTGRKERENKANNPLVSERLIQRLQTYMASLELRGLEDSFRYKQIASLVNVLTNKKEVPHLKPLTSQELADVFINSQDADGNLSKLSEGFGLKTPSQGVNYSDTSDIRTQPVGDYVSHLSRIDKTRLTVAKSKDVSTKPTDEEKPLRAEITLLKSFAGVDSVTVEQIQNSFSAEAISKFIASLATNTLEEAVIKFRNNIKEGRLYLTNNKRILSQVQKRVGPRVITKEAIREDLFDSVDVTESIREGGPAHRDFLRATVIMNLLGVKATTVEDLYPILNFVRTNYFQFSDQNPTGFSIDFLGLMEKYNTDGTDLIKRMNEIIKAYQEIADEYNVSFDIKPIVETTDEAIIVDMVLNGLIFNLLEGFQIEGSQFNGITTVGIQVRRLHRENTINLATPFSDIVAAVSQNTEPTQKDVNDVQEALDKGVEPPVPSNVAQAENEVVAFAETMLSFLSNNPTASEEEIIAQSYEINEDLADAFLEKKDDFNNWREFLNYVIAEGTLSRSKRFLTEDAGRTLNAQEVANLVDKYTPVGFFETLKYIFSGKGSKELFNIVKFNELANSQGQSVWGLYKDGVMSFAQLATGGVSSKVVRHELFHKIFWEYLKPTEQMQALALAQEKYGDIGVVELEEVLAEEFEDFVATKRMSVLSRLWNKLKRLLGFSYNNMSSIEEFFNLIENKAFYKKINTFGEVERASLNIRSVFDDYQEFKIVKDLILNKVVSEQVKRRDAEKKGSGVAVKSFAEITVEAMGYLQQVQNMNASDFPDSYTPEQINRVKRAVKKALTNAFFLKNFNDEYFSNTNNRSEFIQMLKEVRNSRLAELQAARDEIEARSAENEELAMDDEELSNDDIGSLTDETLDSMLVDPKTKLTGSIKQRLISISYYTRGIENYADLSTAFTILVPKIASIPTHSLEEALEALSQTFGKPKLVDRPNIKEAVTNHMSEVIFNLQSKLKDKTIPRNVVFRKDATEEFMYALIDVKGGDVTKVSNGVVQNNPDRYIVKTLEKGKSAEEFIKEVSEAASISKEQAAKVFYFYEDLDFIKSLIAAVGSLRKSNPYIYQKEMVWGRYQMRVFPIRIGGGARTHAANVEFTFDAFVKKAIASGREDLFSQELKTLISTAEASNKLQDKKAAVMAFTSEIGIFQRLTEASEASFNDAFERITKAVPAISSSYSSAQKENESDAEYLERRSGAVILSDETNLVRIIADMINSHYTLAESGAYTRGDGKKAYGWIDASWQTDVLTAIQRASDKLPFKKFSIFKSDGSRLTTTDPFLKDNIFFKKQNAIHGTIEHDSSKWKDSGRWAKTLRKENLKDFRERNIVGNYFHALATRGTKYLQTLPIPSNRTTVQSVRVNALIKDTEINEALLTIIRAQKNRPNPDAKNPDGSFMYPELHNSETYRKRWKQFTFPGLSGNVDSMSEQEALRAIKEHVKNNVFGDNGLYNAFAEQLNKPPQIQVPDWVVNSVANKLNKQGPGKWDHSWNEKDKSKFYEDKNKVVKAGLENFYFNYIINQYSLSQILYGDETFYKSKEDQTKRIQIATATGDTLLTDESFGIPKSSRVLVVEDLKRTIDPNLENLLASSYGQEYEASDGEGFMLPEFYEKVAAAYGFDAKTDVILKPVYFSIENGVPRAIKYSVKVLTPELIKQFPHLEQYAQIMREKQVDQLVFSSAMKIGGPAKNNLAKIDESGFLDTSSIGEDKNIMNINNENLRFQLNPSKNVESSVANMSQGTSMMNTNGKNTAEAYEMHKANAFIIENGLRTMSRDLRLTRKGGVTKGTQIKLRRMLANMVEGLAGKRDVHEMLTQGSGKNKVPLDMPLIGDSVLSTLASVFSSATVSFRFPGSKLVLQADLGDMVIDGVKRRLKWRDEQGFCEVVLPSTYKPYMDKIKDGVIAFRIPSSNYHSLVPLKVVGFYEAPPGSEGNGIIAPSMIVYYHGSDYDVDTLFVARKDYPNEKLDLNDFLKEVDPQHIDSDQFVIEAEEPYGYKNNEVVNINGYKLYEVIDKYIVNLNKQLETLTAQLKFANEHQASVIEEELNAKSIVLEKLSQVGESAAKNFIIHNFSENMRNMKNRTDLLTPISFEAVTRMRKEFQDELEQNLADETFIRKLIDSGLIKQIC